MSEYSIDSLENANECSPRSNVSTNEASVTTNLKVIKNTIKLSSNLPFYLKPTSTLSTRQKDTRSNETAPSTSADRDTRTAGRRNAIIANGGFADASKRRHSATSRNEKQDGASKRLTSKRNHVPNLTKGGRSTGKTSASICTASSMPKKPSTRRTYYPGSNSMSMKADKKLGNVLASRIQQPRSYLELYRRRFSIPRYLHSPEGSTLSICGDSQLEQLTEDDVSLPDTPRDDQSEFSFYRRLIEGSGDQVPRTTRSSETVYQRTSKDSNSFPCLDRVKSNGDKSKKRLGYRPYTIEEYRSLPIPKLDRSLGPDKVEMQVKREWLMRRRSYGNTVSARNRQQILSQMQRIKTRRSSEQKCSLPPLTDQDADAKIDENSLHTAMSVTCKSCGKYDRTCSVVSRKQSSNYDDSNKTCSSRKSKTLKRISSFCSSLNSYTDIVEDSYLESLRQRHFHEKEMVDRIINQALCL